MLLHGSGTGTAVAELCPQTIEAPALVELIRPLPETDDALMADLKTSTTREDLRRIRKAGFTFRVTRDPDAVRSFHTDHYLPSLKGRFPEDGIIESLAHFEQRLAKGGEVLCADLDGQWVAGIFNLVAADRYVLGYLGIRNADDAVRQMRVTSGLLVESFRRGVALGKPQASVGLSLPLLGKGPVWFKAKWGAELRDLNGVGGLHLLLDLRHESIRRMLSDSPILHRGADSTLVATGWLEAGEKPLRDALRETARYPGVTRWHLLATPETLAASRAELSQASGVVPIPVKTDARHPIWLGDVLSQDWASTPRESGGAELPQSERYV